MRILVSFPPGAATEVLARVLANAISPALGQPVIMENRPGAGGNIATVAVRRSPADGTVFLAHSVAFAVNPSLHRNAGYGALADLEPAALLASTPNIVSANPDKRSVRSLPDVTQRLAAAGFAPDGRSRADFAAFLRVKRAGRPAQQAEAANAAGGLCRAASSRRRAHGTTPPEAAPGDGGHDQTTCPRRKPSAGRGLHFLGRSARRIGATL